MNEPILSVIIPTYNRHKYLKGCLEATSRIEGNIEIVVQDNTEDNTGIPEFIKSLDDDRIKYFHMKEHVCVSNNADNAMSHATGKYIVMLGDDDTIVPNLLDAIKFCDENNIDCANFNIPGFNWPDMTFEGTETQPNLFFNTKADGNVRLLNAKKELYKAMRSAEGLAETMPRAYHGIVSKEIMDRIYEKTGSYFPGPSPDMGNAVAVCLLAKNAAYINDYLIVSGYGHDSARGEGNRKAHYGKLNEKPWLPKDILERWDREMPPVFSGETIWADSLTESLSRMGRDDLKKKFNYSALYALFLGHHKDAWPNMLSFCMKKPVRIFRLLDGIKQRNKIRKEYKMNPPDRTRFNEQMGVTRLEDAQDILMKLREEIGVKQLRMAD